MELEKIDEQDKVQEEALNLAREDLEDLIELKDKHEVTPESIPKLSEK